MNLNRRTFLGDLLKLTGLVALPILFTTPHYRVVKTFDIRSYENPNDILFFEAGQTVPCNNLMRQGWLDWCLRHGYIVQI